MVEIQPIGGGSGNVGSESHTIQGPFGDWEIELNANYSTGAIAIEGDIRPSGQLSLPELDVSPETVVVTYRPLEGDSQLVRQVQTQWGNYINQISGLVGTLPPQLDVSGRFFMPDAISNRTQIGTVETPHRDQRTDSFRQSFTFEPLRVPVRESGDLVDQMPDIPFTLTITTQGPLGGVGQTVRELLGGDASVTFNIPPEAIVEEVSLDDFTCLDLNPDIGDSIESLRTNARSSLTEARTVEDRVQQATNTITSHLNAPSLDSISPSQIDDPSAQPLQQAASTIRSIEPPQVNVSNLQSRVSSLRDEVDQISEQRCVSEFTDSLDDISGMVDELESLMNTINNRLPKLRDIASVITEVDCDQLHSSIDSSINSLNDSISGATDIEQSRLQRFISDIDSIRSRVSSDVTNSICERQFESRLNDLESRARDKVAEVLGCSDIPLRIRNRVNTLEGDVSSFIQTGPSRRRQDVKGRLVGEASDLEQTIQSEVASDNPCKSQLLSRVNRTQSRLEEVRVRGAEFIPCSEKFPGIEQQVDSFEQQVVGISSGLTQPELQEIVDNANSLRNQIRDRVPQDDPCRTRLSSRVNSAVESIERSLRSVRVRTAIPSEQQEEFEQQLTDLREQFQQFIEGGRSIGDGEILS